MPENIYKKLIKKSKEDYKAALNIKCEDKKYKKVLCLMSHVSEIYFSSAQNISKKSTGIKPYFISTWYFLNAFFWSFLLNIKYGIDSLNSSQLINHAVILSKFGMHKTARKYAILAISYSDISENNKAIACSKLLKNPTLSEKEKLFYYMLTQRLVNEGKVTLAAKIKIFQTLAVFSKKRGCHKDSENHINQAINIARKYGYKEKIRTIRATLENIS